MRKKIEAKPHAEPAAPEAGRPSGIPIVGIGASAGGLGAFEAFFSGMPTDQEPGMAFVLVQHLAPDHKSILAELIKRYTRMTVVEAQDGVSVQPNCAYIIPPNRDMAILNGSLQLLEPHAPRGQRMPIDYFFRSLAEDQHERAVAIVLSGTGSDGTLGLRAIKGEGGMVMAQSRDSAEYDGMPTSAVATGLVDFVLPPGEMATRLMAYAAHAFKGKAPLSLEPAPLEPKAESLLKKIFVLLRSQTGHDFSGYKPNTIHRRIDRRMAVHQIERLDEYVRLLQLNAGEVEALFRDLLIGVTHFFRDPEAFEALEHQVLPGLFDTKAPGDAIRVWVPGCSTGEEAYSIAMLVQEQQERLKQRFQVQIFATDIDSRAIDQARTGLFPASIAADVSQERLARFFSVETGGGGYRVNKSIRDQLIFSEQDVIKDPPFSKLDLISCRNLMIYLDASLQKRLLPLFHYALNPGGVLFLGTSETVGDFQDLYATLDRKAKLYRKKVDGLGTPPAAFGRLLLPTPWSLVPPRFIPPRPLKGRPPLREMMDQALLDHFSPVAAFINAQGGIVYLHGRTGKYLEQTSGEPSLNLLKIAREGLQTPLTMALNHAVKHKEAAHHPDVKFKANGDFARVHLTVRPMASTPDEDGEPALYLVILEEAVGPDPTPSPARESSKVAADARAEMDTRDSRILSLQEDLRAKEEHLQSANEELATSNEQLRSALEEMQSVNEEMQSTNEELETSKEELQSVNEELATVNAELHTKVTDLSRANNDMNNLLAGTGVGTVFVDHQLRIQRFTPAVTKLINLIQGDIGRPVGHVVSNLVGYTTLVPDIQDVLDTLIPKQIQVLSQADTWYLLNIRPYRTLENNIEGAVLTFTEISELVAAQKALQRLAAVVKDAHDAITVQDLEGRIQAWNPGAERIYGWSEAEAMNMNFRDLFLEGERNGALAMLTTLASNKQLEPHHCQRLTKQGIQISVWLTATALVDERGATYAVATTERLDEQNDSTDRVIDPG